jgi:tRNA G18 (ribose-2'-O)-methylase SpoU
MSDITHVRHKPPTSLEQPRELIVACPPMRSNVNLSRIIRAASCSGVGRIVCCGTAKVIDKIARDGVGGIEIDRHRTLPAVLRRLRTDGYRIVGLEQTSQSECLFDYAFERRTVLVIGNERQGLTEELLAELDTAVEIPVYGPPHSHNAATAAAIAIYEYCRQFPAG